jgi:hypothetical protein
MLIDYNLLGFIPCIKDGRKFLGDFTLLLVTDNLLKKYRLPLYRTYD